MGPITLRTGIATIHGQNLLDTPYNVPAPLVQWQEFASAPHGSVIRQGPSSEFIGKARDDWQSTPSITSSVFDQKNTGWERFDIGDEPVEATGRILAGNLAKLASLAGTEYGDAPGYGRDNVQDGLILCFDQAGRETAEVERLLVGLRLAGWFANARAVLIGRNDGAETSGLKLRDAVRHALGRLGIPLLGGVDMGRVPPQMTLVNGSFATIEHDESGSSLTQALVP